MRIQQCLMGYEEFGAGIDSFEMGYASAKESSRTLQVWPLLAKELIFSRFDRDEGS